jgi:hypothetical protein
MFSPRVRSRIACTLLLLLSLASGAARAEDAKPAGSAKPPADDTLPAEPTPEEKALAEKVMHGVTGNVLRISEDRIVVRNLGEGSKGQGLYELVRDEKLSVTGTKKSWGAITRGDLVAVSYKGLPPRAVGIQVLPPTLDSQIAIAAGKDPFAAKSGREFMGWIKMVDANTMIVRTPDGPPGANRPGDVKTFVRQKDTKVELLRSSWSELKKGDRVSVSFAKGEPRPAEIVRVVLKGGEKPLPYGLATRLYDSRWDMTVKDVDGIGEWPPDKAWPPDPKDKPAPDAKSPAVEK